MRIYVLSEVTWEYNDEDYYRPEGEGGNPVKAFRVRDNAAAECARLNAEARVSRGYDTDGDPVTAYYEVNAVEVADEEVETYADARGRVETAMKAARQMARDAFTAGAAQLFAAWPALDSFHWNQYTPYFNDGESCHFSARTDEPGINGVDYDDYECDNGTEWDRTTWQDTQAREPDEAWKVWDAVVKFLDVFDQDDLLAMFGDHVTVTARRDGTVDTDRCGHD